MYKNSLTSISRHPKKEYSSNLFESHKYDLKCNLKIINNELNTNLNKSHIQDIQIQYIILTEPAKIVQSLNYYFVNIGPNLVQSIQPSNNQLSTFLEHPNPKSIFFVPVLVTVVMDIVNNLKYQKTPGFWLNHEYKT